MPVSLLALRAVQKFSECITFNVLAIPACRNLRLTWFLIHWDGNFVELLNMNRSKDVDVLDLVVFGASCCASLASKSSPLIHQRVAWLQWFVSMVLALPKLSGSKEAPVLCVDDQSGVFL